jgi:ABC-type spermidine/putrescine transport system permease subunit I
MTEEIDPLDHLLIGALRGRPEHTPALDVAAVAIARVNAQQERVAHLARISFWTRLSGVAAGLLLALTAAAGYYFWPASTASSTTDLTDSSSALTTASSIDMTSVGIAAFVVTLIVIVLLTIMTPERQTPRLTPA